MLKLRTIRKDTQYANSLTCSMQETYYRRKFRSQTSDKSRDGKSQRREKKKEDQKRESLRRKKIQVREKVGKLRNIVFFP